MKSCLQYLTFVLSIRVKNIASLRKNYVSNKKKLYFMFRNNSKQSKLNQ